MLDALLVDAARAAGADVRTGVTVEGVTRTGAGRVSGVVARDGTGRLALGGRLVVGADGLRRSRIARAVSVRTLRAEAPLGSTHYTYVAGDWPRLEYHLGDRAFGGVFPTHGGEACVWVCGPAEARAARRAAADVDGAFDLLLREVPTLAARLPGRRRTTLAWGAVALPNLVRAGAGPGWALVGDAAYDRDPVTGHGMSDAFRDADLLAEAVDAVLAGEDEAWALARYEQRRITLLTPLLDVACQMIRFPGRDSFRDLRGSIRLADVIDAESAVLSARPTPLRLAA